MRYFYLTALLLFASFHVAVAQRTDESISLPKPDEVARITIEPSSTVNWYTPESLLKALPCMIPDEGTYTATKGMQRGVIELKNGTRLLWMAANQTSLLIQMGPGERLFVLSSICPPPPILLNITYRAVGMDARRQYPRLYFRLYESGRLEYEVVQRKTEPDTGNASFEIVRKDSQLSAGVVAELIRLAEQPDFLNAREVYSSLVFIRDAGSLTTIVYMHRGREKKIVIKNYRPQHPEAKSFYPQSLIKLLERVDELRPKEQ